MAAVLGILFHYCFLLTQSQLFCLPAFIITQIAFHLLLQYYEDLNYSRPIEVSYSD